MNRLALAAEAWKAKGGMNPRLAANYNLLALAARCGAARAAEVAEAAATPTTVAVDITTLDLRAKGA
jgi:hypothetical protein